MDNSKTRVEKEGSVCRGEVGYAYTEFPYVDEDYEAGIK